MNELSSKSQKELLAQFQADVLKIYGIYLGTIVADRMRVVVNLSNYYKVEVKTSILNGTSVQITRNNQVELQIENVREMSVNQETKVLQFISGSVMYSVDENGNYVTQPAILEEKVIPSTPIFDHVTEINDNQVITPLTADLLPPMERVEPILPTPVVKLTDIPGLGTQQGNDRSNGDIPRPEDTDFGTLPITTERRSETQPTAVTLPEGSPWSIPTDTSSKADERKRLLTNQEQGWRLPDNKTE